MYEGVWVVVDAVVDVDYYDDMWVYDAYADDNAIADADCNVCALSDVRDHVERDVSRIAFRYIGDALVVMHVIVVMMLLSVQMSM